MRQVTLEFKKTDDLGKGQGALFYLCNFEIFIEFISNITGYLEF